MKPRAFALVIGLMLGLMAVPGAQATDGQPLILGQDNSSSSQTSIIFPGLCVGPCGMRLSASGIFFQSGEHGFARLSGGVPAVEGERYAGTAVSGHTQFGDAIVATSNDGNGVVARSFFGDAVSGIGSNRGVIGTYERVAAAPCPSYCAGVLGTSPADGDGVRGTSLSGVGVHGSASAGGGTGVLASAGSDGTALQVEGKSKFSRSGTLTIPAGSSSITQTGINIDSSSVVLATLQQNRSGLWVQAAVPSASGSSFTIYLNHATNSNTAVGWFVVN
jgi:hypothetical protein